MMYIYFAEDNLSRNLFSTLMKDADSIGPAIQIEN